MPDDSDPIAPPLEAPTHAVKEFAAEGSVIEGQARDLNAESADPADTTKSRPEPTPRDVAATGSQWPILGFVASAIAGGILGYLLVSLFSSPPDVSQIDARLNAIETAQATAAKTFDAANKRLDDASKRLAALDDAGANAAKSADLQKLEQRMDAVEKALAAQAPTPAASAPPAPDAAPPAQVDLGPLTARLSALEAKVSDIAAQPDATKPLSARLDALEAKVGDLASKPDPTQPMLSRVASLEAALAAVKADMNASAADPAALEVISLELSQRFESGAPFTAELDKLKQFGVAADVAAALAPMAGHGAPTLQKLAGRFQRARARLDGRRDAAQRKLRRTFGEGGRLARPRAAQGRGRRRQP